VGWGKEDRTAGGRWGGCGQLRRECHPQEPGWKSGSGSADRSRKMSAHGSHLVIQVGGSFVGWRERGSSLLAGKGKI
jgi:hypothetical protein